jgi:hypothetical protein
VTRTYLPTPTRRLSPAKTSACSTPHHASLTRPPTLLAPPARLSACTHTLKTSARAHGLAGGQRGPDTASITTARGAAAGEGAGTKAEAGAEAHAHPRAWRWRRLRSVLPRGLLLGCSRKCDGPSTSTSHPAGAPPSPPTSQLSPVRPLASSKSTALARAVRRRGLSTSSTMSIEYPERSSITCRMARCAGTSRTPRQQRRHGSRLAAAARHTMARCIKRHLLRRAPCALAACSMHRPLWRYGG